MNPTLVISSVDTRSGMDGFRQFICGFWPLCYVRFSMQQPFFPGTQASVPSNLSVVDVSELAGSDGRMLDRLNKYEITLTCTYSSYHSCQF